MILGLQAPIHRLRQKQTKDTTQFHRISNPTSHLQRGPTKQSKPTNEAPALTYTREGPLTSYTAKDSDQRRQSGAGRTSSSAEPGLVPGPLSFGRKVATTISTSPHNIRSLHNPLKAFTISFIPSHAQGEGVVVGLHLYH